MYEPRYHRRESISTESIWMQWPSEQKHRLHITTKTHTHTKHALEGCTTDILALTSSFTTSVKGVSVCVPLRLESGPLLLVPALTPTAHVAQRVDFTCVALY